MHPLALRGSVATHFYRVTTTRHKPGRKEADGLREVFLRAIRLFSSCFQSVSLAPRKWEQERAWVDVRA